jgi:phage terminase large subunit
MKKPRPKKKKAAPSSEDVSVESKAKILKRLRTDPLYHLEKIQGVKTTEEYQKRILEAVAKNERVVVSSCHDTGKTWTLAKVVLWFTSTFRGAKVITTAPTFKQVTLLLWSEIRSGFSNSVTPLGGVMLSNRWDIDDDWFAVGFTSRNEKSSGEGQGNASSFQGFHSKAILVVFDEATGIPLTIWKQVEGLLTSGFVRFVAIANPTSKACEFYQCFSNPIYKKIHLSCFDSPNFVAAGIRNKEDLEKEVNHLRELNEEARHKRVESYPLVNQYLLTVKWVINMILRWGMTHPLVVSKCFGEFPDEDSSCLMSLSLIEAAKLRQYLIQPTDRVSIGVDVARFGNDCTVITVMHGAKVTQRKLMVKRDSIEIVGQLVKLILEVQSKDIHVVIDATGIGSGVVDILKEKRSEEVIPHFVVIRECHFGARAGDTEDDNKTYANLKAKLFVTLAEDLKDEIALLDDDVYAEECPTIKYKYDSKGRWVIESKDEYRARTGRSPDSADSLALANFGRHQFGVGEFTDNMLCNDDIDRAVQNFGDATLW